eukprot:scaffold11869_cov30-Tisochrysis_lutea.AAC.2
MHGVDIFKLDMERLWRRAGHIHVASAATLVPQVQRLVPPHRTTARVRHGSRAGPVFLAEERESPRHATHVMMQTRVAVGARVLEVVRWSPTSVFTCQRLSRPC